MQNQEELLRTTLAHEFYRCTKAFNTFAYLMAVLPQNNTKEARLECYGCYVDFLAHLYEFYKGNIVRSSIYKQTGPYKDYPLFNGLKTKGNESKILDIIFNDELQKLCRNRKARFLRGHEDPFTRDAKYYDQAIPKEFGSHFRLIRNLRNHTDYRRASNESISLKDFFNSYHKFILILYVECLWTWQIDVNTYDWKEIDDFASKILEKHNL